MDYIIWPINIKSMRAISRGWVRFGAICGLIGALFFSVMWIVAVFVDGNWIMGKETLSELGGNRPGALFFNSGVIVEGILGLFYGLGLLHAVRKGILQRTGITILLMASFALIMIGVFPITTGFAHGIASYAFFGMSLVAMSFMVYPLWTEARFGPNVGIATLSSVTVSLAFLFATTVPLAEAVAVICLLIWSSLISILMLTRDEGN
jgi:hypothetical membrane protein